jgi:hypothetical protein
MQEWWWSVGRCSRRCTTCREPIPVGVVFAYQHESREVLCRICVEQAELVPKTSRRLLKPPVAHPATGKKKPNKNKYRTLPSLDGPVRYIDSNWSEAEWTLIADAVSRMTG